MTSTVPRLPLTARGPAGQSPRTTFAATAPNTARAGGGGGHMNPITSPTNASNWGVNLLRTQSVDSSLLLQQKASMQNAASGVGIGTAAESGGGAASLPSPRRRLRPMLNPIAPAALPPLDFSYLELRDISEVLKEEVTPRSGLVKPVEENIKQQPEIEQPVKGGRAYSIGYGNGPKLRASSLNNRNVTIAEAAVHARLFGGGDTGGRNRSRVEALDEEEEPQREYTHYDAIVIRLCNNMLTNLRSIPDLGFIVDLSRIVQLDLSCNAIASLPDSSVWGLLSALRVLFLHKNQLADPNSVMGLAVVSHLESLTLHNNPLQAKLKHYRTAVIHALPQLKRLDSVPVTRRDKPAYPELLLPPVPRSARGR